MADRDFEVGGSSSFKRRWYEIEANVYAPAVALVTTVGAGPGGGALRGEFSYENAGTIAVGGTSQEAVPANTDRSALFIQNLSSENLWISLTGGVAAADSGIKLLPDASLSLPGDIAFVPTTQVNIVGATAGSTYYVLEA